MAVWWGTVRSAWLPTTTTATNRSRCVGCCTGSTRTEACAPGGAYTAPRRVDELPPTRGTSARPADVPGLSPQPAQPPNHLHGCEARADDGFHHRSGRVPERNQQHRAADDQCNEPELERPHSVPLLYDDRRRFGDRHLRAHRLGVFGVLRRSRPLPLPLSGLLRLLPPRRCRRPTRRPPA